MQDRKST